MRRGRVPLLDPRLVTTPGYLTGSMISMVYFSGFTGIWVVLALFFQDGLGYTPLGSGLAVSSFALSNAVAAPIAGRMLARAGRRLTVSGLAAVIVGLLASALVLRHIGGDAAA